MNLLMFRTLFPRIAPLVLALLLASCASTRVEPPLPAAAPAQFKEDGLWKRAASSVSGSALPVPDAWWQLYNDPVLNDLQGRLVIGNENLKAAVAQVATARAAVAASRAQELPTVAVNPSASRSGGPAGSNGQRTTSTSLSLGATANWEIDLWGRLAQATSSSEAKYQASVDDLAAARLSAQATLVQTYLSMRAAEAQAILLERSVAGYQRSLDLTQTRYNAGVVARADVLQAQTQLKSAQAQIIEVQTQRAQLEHAIAVLLGQPPSAVTIMRTGELPESPSVPVLLPATLLERRPDIAAAERRVAAAYALIGVADAAFFPALTLSASGGFRGSSLSNLLNASNFYWSLGSALAQAIFDGGARRAASDQARAAADAATAAYRQQVLTAFQEAEDNLVLADQLRTEGQLQREALQLSQRTLEIVMDQYRAGTVSYLNVVTAQSTVLASEQSVLSVRNRELAAINQLLKNIAGRWQDK